MNAPIKILLVDDHAIVRAGLRMSLEGQPDFVIVGEASDGASAIQEAAKLEPDVVLIDLRMPIMNGIDATSHLKALPCHPKVLIITSNESDSEMRASLSAGADGFCVKAASIDTIVLAIRSVHSGATWLHPGIAQLLLKMAAEPKISDQSHACASPEFKLSTRELEVLAGVVNGMTNPQIAATLHLSPQTVKTHMTNIIAKLNVADRTQAAVLALRAGLLQ